MGMKGDHSCAGSILQYGTQVRCICADCKHDWIGCCFDHGVTCPSEDNPVQFCYDYEKEDEDNE